ncbi:MAG TPA: helix-turn-helix domain-containing protein [Actinomycetota bacterium]
MRSPAEVARALELCARGLNDCEISRRTGIPRGTIRDWRHGKVPRQDTVTGTRLGRNPCPVCYGMVHTLLSSSYAYLLGLYLGDGTITAGPRSVFRLKIFLDLRYPAIVEACGDAMGSIFLTKVGRRESHDPRYPDGGMAVVYSYSKHWPCVFPQHGPGMKHTRSIVLTDWQEEVLRLFPDHLLRGLIHSDGCRSMNRVQKRRYSYPRYMFSNKSDDILDIFTRACDQIGVAWTRSRRDCISVARTVDTARLDTFIGPKR